MTDMKVDLPTGTTPAGSLPPGVLTAKPLQWPDYIIIFLYVVFVMAVGYISSRRSKDDLSGYFLASRSMHWIVVGTSIFASNLGSTLFIGLAGSGAASGVAVAAFELNAVYILMLLGWLFVPVYMSSGVYTMPEYLRERFGGQRIRVYLGVLSLLLYVFTKISGDLFAGALFIQEAVGETSSRVLYGSVLALLGVAGLFTIAGGLTAVMWTDFVQTILIVVGAFVLTGISYAHIGGYDAVREKFEYAMPRKLVYDADNNTCGVPTPYAHNLLRPIDDPELPWTGTIFGITVLATWFWCSDQVMVQRALTARNLTHAKAGCVLAAWLKILPLWILVFTGMIARILFPDEVGCVDPVECTRICGSPAGCTNIAYVKLVLGLMPVGMRGCMLSVMLAAIMSSLTSIFNSASTIFTIDIWAAIRRHAWAGKGTRQIEAEQLLVGRLSVFVLVIISVLWIPVIQNFSNAQLFVYMQSMTAYLVPPITAVFVLAMLWGRTNEPGAFWGLMVGLAVGLTRFVLEFSFTVPPCGSADPDLRPELLKTLVGKVNYLHFGILLFFLVLAVTVCVSLLTRPIPDKCMHRLTFTTRFSRAQRVSVRDWRNEELQRRGSKPGRRKKAFPAQELLPGQDSLPSADCLSVDSPLLRRVLAVLCCFKYDSADDEVVEAPTHERQIEEITAFLTEEPKQKWWVNCHALICMLAVTFVYGFYA